MDNLFTNMHSSIKPLAEKMCPKNLDDFVGQQHLMHEELVVNLLFIVKNNKILLAEKKRGFGIGILNGCGGKVEQGETIEQSMIREAKEEIGIIPKNLEKVAINIFNIIHKGKRKNLVTHVFKTNEFEGKIAESDEMKPQWFEIEKIPYSKMWQDDAFWLPKVLAGEKVKTYFYFDDDGKMGEYKIEIVNGFENKGKKING